MSIEKSFPASKLLHSFGGALHVVRSMSKAPKNSRWQMRERQSWESLTADFKPKMNLGIRNGSVSLFPDGTHLVILDVDVKSPDPKHFQEAIEKAESICPEIKKAPFSLTGRGNGSRHYFFRTIQKARIEKIFQSTEKCLVDVGGERVERPCWEIMLLGERSQALLPGSIHPDTKVKYVWGKEPQAFDDLPIMSYQQSGAPFTNDSDTVVLKQKYRVIDGVTPWDFGWTPYDIEAIEDGTNVVDRSSEIHRLMKSAIDRGADEDALLTLFTDKNHYLGRAAYEHTKAGGRGGAMRWLDKYCLVPAKRESARSAPGSPRSRPRRSGPGSRSGLP